MVKKLFLKNKDQRDLERLERESILRMEALLVESGKMTSKEKKQRDDLRVKLKKK